jgi:hypothetical protein
MIQGEKFAGYLVVAVAWSNQRQTVEQDGLKPGR